MNNSKCAREDEVRSSRSSSRSTTGKAIAALSTDCCAQPSTNGQSDQPLCKSATWCEWSSVEVDHGGGYDGDLRNRSAKRSKRNHALSSKLQRRYQNGKQQMQHYSKRKEGKHREKIRRQRKRCLCEKTKCEERRRIGLRLSQGCNIKDFIASTGIETQPGPDDEQ